MSSKHDAHYTTNDEYKNIIYQRDQKIMELEKIIEVQSKRLSERNEAQLLKIIRDKNDEIDRLRIRLEKHNEPQITLADEERYNIEMNMYNLVLQKNKPLKGTIRQSKMNP